MVNFSPTLPLHLFFYRKSTSYWMDEEGAMITGQARAPFA